MNALDERSRWRLLRHVAACGMLWHAACCGLECAWMQWRCGCRNLGEALRRVAEGIATALPSYCTSTFKEVHTLFRTRSEPVPNPFQACSVRSQAGASMIRTKGEAGTGDVVEAVRHIRTLHKERSLPLWNILHFIQALVHLQHACSMLATCLQHACLWLWLCLAPYDFLSFWAFHSGDPNGADDGRWWALHLCKGQRNWVKWLTASPIFCNMLPTPWSLADNASGKEIGTPIDLLQQAVVFSSIFEVSAGWRQHNILLRWPVL